MRIYLVKSNKNHIFVIVKQQVKDINETPFQDFLPSFNR